MNSSSKIIESKFLYVVVTNDFQTFCYFIERSQSYFEYEFARKINYLLHGKIMLYLLLMFYFNCIPLL